MKGNYNQLTDEEIEEFDKKYIIDFINDSKVVVRTTGFGTKTLQDAEKGFTLRIKDLSNPGKLKYLKLDGWTLNEWKNRYDKKVSLFKLQNEINKMRNNQDSIDEKKLNEIMENHD